MYGRYNAVGAAAGALGALAAILLRDCRHSSGVRAWLFLVLVPVGLPASPAMACPQAEADCHRRFPTDNASRSGHRPVQSSARLGPSRSSCGLAGLFAVDAAGGGLVTTGFLVLLLHRALRGLRRRARAGCSSPSTLVQAVSVLVAPLLARRFGLVATMVGTHLPSNVLLAAVAFAPNFACRGGAAAGADHAVADGRPDPAGLVMTVVTPGERTAAAAVTNAARYTVRPVGPLVAAGRCSRSRSARRWCSPGRQGRLRPGAVAVGAAPPRCGRSRHRPRRRNRRMRAGDSQVRSSEAMIVCLRTVAVPPEWREPVPGLDRRRPRDPQAARHPRRTRLRTQPTAPATPW